MLVKTSGINGKQKRCIQSINKTIERHKCLEVVQKCYDNETNLLIHSVVVSLYSVTFTQQRTFFHFSRDPVIEIWSRYENTDRN